MNVCKKITQLALGGILLMSLASCNAKKFYDQTYDTDCNQLTLGIVQKEICQGMSQDQVASVLGSPNIVTRDKDGKEAWIYDKIASQVRASGSSGILLFCQTGADYVNRKEVSQQTLTVVIKYDENRLIDTISYHSSKF